MARRLLVFILLAACVSMRPVLALPAPQTAPAAQAAVDRDLLARLIAADDAARQALITANPAVGDAAFLRALAAEGQQQRSRNLAASERAYGTLLAVGEQLGNTTAILDGLNGLASVAGTRGDAATAIGLLDRAKALAEKTNNRQALQMVLNGQGIMLRQAGQLTASLEMQFRALDLARELDLKAAAASSLHNIGFVLASMGNGVRALEYYGESLTLKQQIQATPASVAQTLTNIGAVYAEQGDYALAVDYYSRAYELSGAETLATINNLAQAYASAGDNVKARQFAERALAEARAASNTRLIGSSLYMLGIITRSEGRAAEALALQREALEIRERLNEATPLIESYLEIGHLIGVSGNWADALPFLERSTTAARNSRLLNQLWKSELALGHAHAQLGHEADARAAFEGAMRTLEELRSMAAGGERSAQRYLSERMGPFYGLATLDAKSGRTFEALQTIDRARARFLVDVIASGQPVTRDLTAAEADEERSINDAVGAATAALEAEVRKPKPDATRVKTLEDQLARARLRRDAFRGELYARRPSLALARGSTPELTRAALAGLLPAGRAVVIYMLDERQPWAFVATGGDAGPTVTAHALSLSTQALVELTDGLAHRIATRDLGFAPDARKAYDALLGPLERRLAGVSTLTIMPDGPLWHLPFQALRTPRGRFLIEERAVSYTPSLSALAALEARRGERPRTEPFLVALGDPAIPEATFAAGSPTRALAARRLPEAAREVKALGRLYGDRRSEVFVEDAATEAALRAEVARASVLHVATHGVFEDRNPMYSHLLLVPGGKGASADHRTDGRLEAWEVLDLGLNADVAILSACQTARGGDGFGEGVIGLSWSLFASGASTAVVSQWEVDSASTTSLMLTFHRRLLAAGSRRAAPEALRAAAIEMLKTPAYRHPFYWAGFISLGAR